MISKPIIIFIISIREILYPQLFFMKMNFESYTCIDRIKGQSYPHILTDCF